MAGNPNKEATKTVLVVTVGFLIVFLFTDIKAFLTTAVIVGLVGVLSNYLARKIHWLWMKLSWILSLIVPNILLSVIFYLFLTPIAFLSRLFSKQDQLFLKNPKGSLFKSYNKEFTKESFEKPW